MIFMNDFEMLKKKAEDDARRRLEILTNLKKEAEEQINKYPVIRINIDDNQDYDFPHYSPDDNDIERRLTSYELREKKNTIKRGIDETNNNM